ncbi:hypothetical protein CALCODRAFT_474882 [Calocera cornea HHB12733]|uniref:Uncharacterized protein n=1 Tax=Calocera cornea HHB12733 TaxID=1353952 RepID=A0A165DQN8_9BASI|nr:hypothetical protein CALCODRAFT_474882 [Calocera cornea HHB12733]
MDDEGVVPSASTGGRAGNLPAPAVGHGTTSSAPASADAITPSSTSTSTSASAPIPPPTATAGPVVHPTTATSSLLLPVSSSDTVPPIAGSSIPPPPTESGPVGTALVSGESTAGPSRSSSGPIPAPAPAPAPVSAPPAPAPAPTAIPPPAAVPQLFPVPIASVELPSDPSAGPLDPSANYTFHRGVLSALARMTARSSSSASDEEEEDADDEDDCDAEGDAELDGDEALPGSGPIDQSLLRRWLALAPTFLLLDASTHPSPQGLASWQLGLRLLINLMLALHSRGQLEWETMNAASKALAECWSISLCWTGLEGAKGAVQGAGGRLKAVLDRDDPTRYRGRALYPVEG